MAPELQTLLRFVLATALFLPWVAFARGIRWPGLRALAGDALISATYVGFFWAMFEALRWTSALNAAALYNLLPAIAALWSFLLVRERIGGTRLVALALGALGALWVVFRGEPATVMSFWTLVTGTVWLLAIANIAVFRTDWTAVPGEVYLGVAYLAVFTTILTSLIMQHGTLHIGPTRVASYGYLAPVFVVAIEFLPGHGLPSAMTWPGLVLVVAATVVLQRGAGRERGA